MLSVTFFLPIFYAQLLFFFVRIVITHLYYRLVKKNSIPGFSEYKHLVLFSENSIFQKNFVKKKRAYFSEKTTLVL